MIQATLSETMVLTVFGVAAGVMIAVATLIVLGLFLTAGAGEDAVRDVQRYLELTEEARALLPNESALANPDGETSAAIDRFLAKKEEARRALWESRGRPAAEHAATEKQPRLHQERRVAPERGREAPRQPSPAKT